MPLDDDHWMHLAIELAHRCPPSDSAFSVGAVIVGADGVELSHGFSRETDATVHAEESALAKLAPGDERLHRATIYSTLEPCSQRASRPRPCAQLILDAGIPRVVIAWREPGLFVADAQGTGQLAAAGVEVVELTRYAEPALAANSHLPIGVPTTSARPRVGGRSTPASRSRRSTSPEPVQASGTVSDLIDDQRR